MRQVVLLNFSKNLLFDIDVWSIFLLGGAGMVCWGHHDDSGVQFTSGFSNAAISSQYEPGDLLSGPGDSQNDPNGNGSWGAGRTTNIMYHGGWLMTGSEAPGSRSDQDKQFRVYKIEDPLNPVRMFPVSVPSGIPYPGESFGLSSSDYPDNHWGAGNWGFHTHGHFVTQHSLLGRDRVVERFGGAMHVGWKIGFPSEGMTWPSGSITGVAGSMGRAQRASMWGIGDDWAYGDNANYHFLNRLVVKNPASPSYSNNGIDGYPIARMVGGIDGVRGFPAVVGDKVILLSDQRNSGAAVYQIPQGSWDILDNPSLRTSIQNVSKSTGDESENGLPGVDLPDLELIGVMNQSVGGYWPELYASEGALYAVYTKTNNVQVVLLDDGSGDFSDPVLVRDFANFEQYANIFGRTNNIVPTNASYPKFQDNLLMFNSYVVNMDRLIAGHEDPVDVVLKADHHQRTSQYSLPLGNLVVTGGYSNKGGMSIWVRQNAPDTTRPEVAYHIPRRNASNYPRWAALSFLIHETLDN